MSMRFPALGKGKYNPDECFQNILLKDLIWMYFIWIPW